MSDTKNNKELEIIEETKFWNDRRAVNVFNLFVAGKDISSIAEVLKMKPVTVESMVVKKFFIKKLESHLKGVLFTNQVAKVIASSDVFSKLWERVIENINDIPPEICLKELTKLFPSTSIKKDGLIINPKNMNVFIKAMKGEVNTTDPDERLDEVDLDEDLGYDGLDDDSNAVYPELGEGQQPDGNKQGDHPMDPEEQDKN